MIPHHIYVQGSYIDIHDCVTVNLSCNGAEVHVEKKPAADAPAPETENPESSDIGAHLTHFTDDQVKGSGIRCQPRVALALMCACSPSASRRWTGSRSTVCCSVGIGWTGMSPLFVAW